MSDRNGQRPARRSRRSVFIGNSEIRPIRGTGRERDEREQDGQRRTGAFIPGGSYRTGKFPALERLMRDWEQE
jgi:hypothetical protein